LHICISCIDTELLTEILVMRYGLPLKLRRKIIEFFVSKICNKRIIYYICTRNQATLAYGVIGNTADFGSVVLGSSPSRPTKNLSYLRGFFVLYILVKKLYSEGYNRPYSMVNQVFAYAAVKKVRKAFSAMCAHPYKVGINTVGKM
jgi:hypothetical protein